MKSAEIRAAFLEFFAERGCEVVPSSPLVPANDPTLLFTNSGMVQFKGALTGTEDLGFTRAVSAQRCVRAGGKHNDLENVGYTARHHTFFEMLGNFSFGDYFKEEAITWAWSFVTDVLGIPAERLWVTVHHTDDEAAELWRDRVGVPAERIVRLGDEDNFWAMGDTGPCGPCTEIFYDHGPDVPGGPPGSPEADGDRYIEIWNLVFPQYERFPDGRLEPLANPGVDTGMGLERVAAVLQGVHSNYEIDTFRSLIAAAGELAGIAQGERLQEASLRVIADHIRSCAFLIADGVEPGNEGRGYVLRRIVRRALRHGHKLGMAPDFFHRLVGPLADEMGDAYPLLREQRKRIETVLAREEEQFDRTLSDGMALLEKAFAELSGRVLDGDTVFRLYDTYGFPADLTADIARERGLDVDMDGFETAMAAQRERARAASRFKARPTLRVEEVPATRFTGYDGTQGAGTVVALFQQDDDGNAVACDALEPGRTGMVVLDTTPFYAESGGQVGDTGLLEAVGAVFEVNDTQKSGEHFLHEGQVRSGRLAVGDAVNAQVDARRRQAVALNHSATHLLHAALREVLGDHVEQKGSLVAPDRLRFDFSHPEALSPAELARIERRVNEQIRANVAVRSEEMAFDDAREAGAMALFGEKYGDRVRVLTMADGWSVELCGGTHVRSLGDIGQLHVVAESGVAAGVRRVEAVTGAATEQWLSGTEETLARIARVVKGSRDDAAERVEALARQNRELQKELQGLRQKLAGATGADMLAEAHEVDGVRVLARTVDVDDPKGLLETLDSLRERMQDGVVLLGAVIDGRVHLIAGVNGAAREAVKAGDLIKTFAPRVGAKGGGRPDMARAGGGDRPDALDDVLAEAREHVLQALGAVA
jgi:alanyl-tRNA synthetase